jgi:hypothetical protein
MTQSRPPPPTLEDAERSAVGITGEDAAPIVKGNDVLQLEKAGVPSRFALMFLVFPMNLTDQ